MVKRKEEEKILDVDAAMQGTLVFSDPVNLRINGKFEGHLKTQGNLIVGENASISADIVGESIVISGLVKGNIKSTRLLSITSTATVYGDVETPKFSIEEGAFFNGKCKMQEERFSVSELSHYLSVETSKIIEWVNAGKIPARKEGSNLSFDKKEVELWVEENR